MSTVVALQQVKTPLLWAQTAAILEVTPRLKHSLHVFDYDASQQKAQLLDRQAKFNADMHLNLTACRYFIVQ